MCTNKNNTYIGITFGPISRVISYAQSTKELWAASYFFSYLAKRVVEPVRTRTFLMPQLKDEMYDKEKTRGAGLFPDRYIFQSKEGDYERLCKYCNDLYEEIGKQIAVIIGENEQLVADYLKHTIKIYFFEKEYTENEDIVKECEYFLACMEFQDLFPQEEDKNYLAMFFKKVNGSFLTDDAFKGTKSRLFETIIEYSAFELSKQWGKELLNEEKTGCLEKKGILRPYHKYIAFVKADGDNMTKTITGLKAAGRAVKELDEALLTYNLKVVGIIEKYGGKAIFLGGDDLLFYAPVKNGKKNIYTLLQDIDDEFKEALKGLPSPPTLSFGVSMSYYKFPMFEAIEKAEILLEQAKHVGKNRIAWQLRKHSGQLIGSVIDKREDCIYKQCIALIETCMESPKDDERLFNSFTYWLIKNKDILLYILKKLQPDILKCQLDVPKRQLDILKPQPTLLELQSKLSEKNAEVDRKKKEIFRLLRNYFTNSFNEPEHGKMDGYIELQVRYLVDAAWYYSEDMGYAVDSLHAILRFVGFLKSKKS